MFLKLSFVTQNEMGKGDMVVSSKVILKKGRKEGKQGDGASAIKREGLVASRLEAGRPFQLVVATYVPILT